MGLWGKLPPMQPDEALDQESISVKELIVRERARSGKYVAGTSGWKIDGDGSAEFTNATIRGSLNADDIGAGTLNVDRISAHTLQFDKLVFSSFDNLIPNPGFEIGDLGSTNDPHYYGSGTGGTWSTATTAARSGGRAARFDVDSQSAAATLQFGGLVSDRNSHPEATDGDVFYFLLRVRYIDAAPTTDCKIWIQWRDETGADLGSSASTTCSGLTTAYQDFEVSGTAPAGTAYAAFYWSVASGNGSTVAFLMDDAYARRKSATGTIEDQAVDIQRMLNPVHADTVKATNSTNDSWTTTISKWSYTTFTIPSWVGEVHVLCFAFGQMTNSSGGYQLIYCSARIGGTDNGAGTWSVDNGQTSTGMHIDRRDITAPGSSLEVAAYNGVDTGTNSANVSSCRGSLLGIR